MTISKISGVLSENLCYDYDDQTCVKASANNASLTTSVQLHFAHVVVVVVVEASAPHGVGGVGPRSSGTTHECDCRTYNVESKFMTVIDTRM